MDEKIKVKVYSLSNDLLDEFDFNKTIRFDDLRKVVIKDGISIVDCNRNLIINYTSNGSYEVLIYRHKHGRLQWNVPLEDFTIEDYLEEFPTDEIKLIRIPYGVGGIIFPGVEWETICEVLKNIYEIGGAILTTYEIYKMLKDTKVIPKIIDKMKSIFLNDNVGIVEYQAVTKFITSKNQWSLAEFKFQMNLDNDEELAKLLLGLSGYLYSEKYDLYFFNKEYAEKGKKELHELVTHYINHRKTRKD